MPSAGVYSAPARPGSLWSYGGDKGQGGRVPARCGLPVYRGEGKGHRRFSLLCFTCAGNMLEGRWGPGAGIPDQSGEDEGREGKAAAGRGGVGSGGDAPSADGLQPRDSCREPHEESAWGLCTGGSSGMARGLELYDQELQESL